MNIPKSQGLYDSNFEHDACGVGFICHMRGEASHQIVDDALSMLEHMHHRGASGCEPDSGDGAGIMVFPPDLFLRRRCKELGMDLPPYGQYACGTIFLPQDMVARRLCIAELEKVVHEYGMIVLGWRDVPVDSTVVGPTPRQCEPKIRQVFVAPGQTFFNRRDFDRRLYFVRQRAENVIEFGDLPSDAREDFYICGLSTNRLVYKGMLTALQLRKYYMDLNEPDFKSAFAMVHSRFSTNTFPSWRLAHPYRYLAHNGEINTLRGNRNWMRARYASLKSEIFGDELPKMFPLLTESGSDSATLDNALQFLAVNNRSLPHAVLMLIPEAWQNNPQMDPDLRAFYEYHACMMEPWDGPASISFTNGYLVGAVLDRNGLRPSRYCVTKDDLVVMASEVGAFSIAPERIEKKWRLQPGRIFLVDMNEGRIIEDSEIKQGLVDKRPWRRWIENNLVELDSLPVPESNTEKDESSLITRQHAFGYTNEDIKFILSPMATNGLEPVGSMGSDTPLACLSEKPVMLFNYFKQLFAQVTNPPLDAIREEFVTSLYTYLGRQHNLLEETPRQCRILKLKQPILSNTDLEKVRNISLQGMKAVTLPMLFDPSFGENGLEDAVETLCKNASQAIADGATIIIISDRGIDRDTAPIPSLLACSALHHHLIREGTRTLCDIVVETGEAREAHHFCLLIGYGAGAVNPYLAFETIDSLVSGGILPAEISAEQARKNYTKAANKAILKVASKMGISTVQSYRGAQIFEAIGLSKALINRYFTHTPSRIGGIGLDVIAEECAERHHKGFPRIAIDADVLEMGGQYQWRSGGEYHSWNPETVAALQNAVRIDSFEGFKHYTKKVDEEAGQYSTIRGLLQFRPGNPIPIDEVELAKDIVKRFVTGAMSFGSISREAHETLAIAMNRIGGKSNTGEGGEDPDRFTLDDNGDLRRSAIKQVASARFGVTTEYLVNADELQIKMAQGAKPGEGGQLPGHKVDEYVGKIRHSTPGVQLISPPPHHDIYSIEDLAQLIHDLKNVNSNARISVKLVSEVGVGTVAAGVAKCKADHILISGDSGGTGASPLTSIKHAGLPWELGLAEAQQTLVLNKLRGRVVLQVDGQFKTGRDVVIGALLGAEEFGFSTAPLISIGCVMMRACHLNTCPVGIATQDPELRMKFAGKPEHVINFMFFIAEEVREYMAMLGVRKFEDLVGQTQMLEVMDLSQHRKAKHLDMSAILYKPDVPETVALRNVERQDHGLSEALDHKLLELAAPAIQFGERVSHEMPIRNINRAVGAMLSGQIARKFGYAGLPDDTITFRFIGSAGQSFGSFLSKGVSLFLEGDSNDYLGKGLCGGKIAVFPPKSSTFIPEENIIAGNVVGYGAIAGEIYLRGVVGERFCVRNSGASAVVEGVGDHACEYMTGGRVVVLGTTGRNFAAGMSGGIAYVYDREGGFPQHCNRELVDLEEVPRGEEVILLRSLIENHLMYTGSTLAKCILADWDANANYFLRVMPRDYRRVLERSAELEKRAKELSQLKGFKSQGGDSGSKEPVSKDKNVANV